MIIKIKNFGPIKEFEIDLSKDFSIIYGKNNIGKSYAVSVIYLILKKIASYTTIHHLKWEIEQLRKRIEDTVIEPITIKGILSELKTETASSPSIASIEFMDRLIELLHESFTVTFGDNISNKFSNEETEIYINTDKAEIVLCRENDKFTISKSTELGYVSARFQQLGNIYYLPASRIGIYQGLSSFSSIFAELSKSRGSIKKSFEIPSFPEPVSDYILAITSIKKGVSDPNNPIVLLAEEIEQTVLGGEVFFDDDTKKMIYKPYKTDLYLEMFQVSSMVAGVSPLVLFLKYIIAPSHKKTESNSLLFIEEPEAHLHPETQIKLMEIFAKLVNHNIKIIITSHSDFMFNKMNNLILDKKLDISKSCAIILEQSEQGSISKVLPMDDLGVEDENFLATTEYLFNERTDLIDKLNQDS